MGLSGLCCIHSIVAEGWLVAFQLPGGLSSSDRTRFHDAFWGRTTKTWGGRYEYHRAGLMEAIPHHRLIRGVFVIRQQDRDRVVEFLQGWKAECHVRRVHLDREDLGSLKE